MSYSGTYYNSLFRFSDSGRNRTCARIIDMKQNLLRGGGGREGKGGGGWFNLIYGLLFNPIHGKHPPIPPIRKYFWDTTNKFSLDRFNTEGVWYVGIVGLLEVFPYKGCYEIFRQNCCVTTT